MKRRIVDLVAAVGLTLSVGIFAWQIRSYWSADYAAYCGQYREVGVISSVGRVIVYREEAIGEFSWRGRYGMELAARDAPLSLDAYAMPFSSRQVSWMGFGMMSGNNGRYRAAAWFVPHWVVGSLIAVVAGLLARRRLRYLALRRGFEVASGNGSAEAT